MNILRETLVPVRVSLEDASDEGVEALFSSPGGGLLVGPLFSEDWNARTVRIGYIGQRVEITGQLVLQKVLNEQWAFVRVASVSFGAYRVEVVLAPYSVEGPPFDAAHIYLWRLYSPEGELLPHLGFRLGSGIQSGIDEYLAVLRKPVESIFMGTGALADLWEAIKPA